MMSNLKTITIASLFMLMSPFYAYTCTYAKELPQQNGVSINKIWNIKFNEKIDYKTLYNNITITDASGKMIDTILSLNNDCKTVTVTPKGQYKPGQVYKITINKNVKSLKESAALEAVTKVFSTQSQEDILAHLPPTDWNPFIASDKELTHYGYPSRPNDTQQLKEWKKSVTGGWYDPESDTIPNHSHTCIPCKIVWNKQVYDVDVRCGPINGQKIGQTSDGGDIYQIPGVSSSYGVILEFSDKDGHRCTRIDYNASDALSMLFSDPSEISGKVGNLQFPQSATKIKTSVNVENKSIPVELATEVDESDKPIYIITLIETWNTKGYYHNGCIQTVRRHYWRFRVLPNGYDYLDQGGDVPPQTK
ncbi:hypothetical protein B5S50_03870 [Clostridium sp. 001]|nr:hypothetical protein B5S50_03870 [Clostridium sp. 001]